MDSPSTTGLTTPSPSRSRQLGFRVKAGNQALLNRKVYAIRGFILGFKRQPDLVDLLFYALILGFYEAEVQDIHAEGGMDAFGMGFEKLDVLLVYVCLVLNFFFFGYF